MKSIAFFQRVFNCHHFTKAVFNISQVIFPTSVMLILRCFIPAHLIGDFLLQTRNVAYNKHKLIVLMYHS